MKIDFVTPRYGPVGGAENAVSALASRLAEIPEWEVRLHATCATSSSSWVNDESPGESRFGSLTVNRYLVDSGRTAAWSLLDHRIQSGTSSVDPVTQDEFFFHQGPVSNDLSDAVEDSEADLVFFAPYLFWPTMDPYTKHCRRHIFGRRWTRPRSCLGISLRLRTRLSPKRSITLRYSCSPPLQRRYR